MNLAAALDLVVARTGHARYRALCDPAHPDYHPGCPDTVVRLAAQFGGADPAAVRPQHPRLLGMAAAFAGAVVKHVAAGMPQVSDEQYDARLKACETSGPGGGACPNLLLPEWRCAGGGCGCWLRDRPPLPGKARWADQACPLGKWPR